MTVISTFLKNGSVERIVDVNTYLFERNNLLWLTGEINSDMANSIISAIMVMSARSSKDIILLIDSPGGSVSAGMAIIDAMNVSACDVRTVAVGTAASMGALILASGTPGKRYCMPNSEVMIHQPLGGAQGAVSDVEILTKRLTETKERIRNMLSHLTGQSPKAVARHMDRDTWFSPKTACEFGLVDRVLDHLPNCFEEVDD